ncbi:hypothetical protein [Rhizobium tubonense]|nr:hypothetical protein [Rhizobium tubonense]
MAYLTFLSVSQQDARPALLPLLRSFVEVASVVFAFGFVFAFVIGVL